MKQNQRRAFATSPGKSNTTPNPDYSNSEIIFRGRRPIPVNLNTPKKAAAWMRNAGIIDDLIRGDKNALATKVGRMAAQAALDKVNSVISNTNASGNIKLPPVKFPSGASIPDPYANLSSPSKGGPLTVFRSVPRGLNNSYALSKAPNPKDISLNSRIKPNTYANDYMTPIELSCSPLQMSIVSLGIPTSPTNPLASYFTNTICFDIQTRAQANVGFALDIANILNTTNLVQAFNSVIQALQVYFYYSSIMSYESDPRNKNAGMIALRATIDAQTMSDLSQLGKRLEDCAVPPRLVEWVRYMNGNFLSGPSCGSPIIKLGFDAGQFTAGGTPVRTPSAMLSQLNTTLNNQVFSILRRAIPQWRIGTLYDCSPVPTFDLNFLNIFANIPGFNKQTGVYQRSATVADFITSVPYNSFTNKPDGVAFAMSNVYNSVSNEFIPSLCTPYGANDVYKDTRFAYYSVSGVKAFYAVSAYPFLALSRMETQVFLTGTAGFYSPHLPGAEKCQAVTGNSLVQTAQESLDFLFQVNSIPVKGSLSSFNRRGLV